MENIIFINQAMYTISKLTRDRKLNLKYKFQWLLDDVDKLKFNGGKNGNYKN